MHLSKRSQQLVGRVLFWLVSEIALNLAGLDDLADYSEFLAQAHDLADLQVQPHIQMVAYASV